MKHLITCVAILLTCLLFAGCTTTMPATKPGTFYLYFIDNEGVSLRPKAASLAGEDTKAQIEEVLNRLSDPEEAGDYAVAIPNGISVSEYELRDGILSLHFNEEYGGLLPASEIMLRACVVKTLMQLSDVNAVAFFIGDKPFTDAAGNEPGPQNDETFLTSFGEETDDIESRVFVLYYASEKGDSLIRVEKRIHYNSNTALESLVLEYLAEDPKVKGARAAIADG
ncbi:MAG: GerMN domain-containing protein, partial [Lachnospiraceae bacterium]|nr:GerMN domain-containing protein [Lachnospiraceae bacterium]